MLCLRPYNPSDAHIITGWLEDERAMRQWCADQLPGYPPTPEMLNTYYKERTASPDFWAMTAYDEEGVMGHLFMRFTDNAHQVLRFGFVVVDPRRRGRGLGRELILSAKKYAFDLLHVQRVTLGVFENNPRARKCYESAGFTLAEPPHTIKILGEEWVCIELACLGA